MGHPIFSAGEKTCFKPVAKTGLGQTTRFDFVALGQAGFGSAQQLRRAQNKEGQE